MTTRRAAATKRSDVAICPTVSGGRETTATSRPEISNTEFLQALQESLGASGLRSVASDQLDARCYRLAVALDQLEHGGWIEKARAVSTTWTLEDPRDGSQWRTTIRSVGNATAGDSIVGVSRLRVATERAAAATIDRGIDWLLQLDLSTAGHRKED